MSIKDLFTNPPTTSQPTAQAPVEINYGAAAVLNNLLPFRPKAEEGQTVSREDGKLSCVDCGKLVKPKHPSVGAVVCSDCVTLREIRRRAGPPRRALSEPAGSVAGLFATPIPAQPVAEHNGQTFAEFVAPDAEEEYHANMVAYLMSARPLSWILSRIEEGLPHLDPALKDATFRRAKPNVPGKVRKQGKRTKKEAQKS